MRRPIGLALALIGLLVLAGAERRGRSAYPHVEFAKGATSSKPLVLEGHSVVMECQTTTVAPIYWTLNDEKIVNTPRRSFSSAGPSSILTITRAMRKVDSGKYRCVATTQTGHEVFSDEVVQDVTWLDYPVVESEYPDEAKDIVKDVDVQLACEANVGSGDVQYHWFRNSERVSSKMEGLEVKKKTLHIEKINASYNGVYRCNIHLNGEVRESKSNYVINIKDESLPQITLQPSDLLLPVKSLAIFNCQYTRADSIEWFKNDNNIPLETNDRITIHKNGSLSIKNITRRDEGFYSCVAYRNNEKMQLQKFSARLKIAYIKALSLLDFEPEIPENRVVIAQEGESFILTCLNHKDNAPSSQIMWKNTLRHLVSDSGEIKVDGGSLIIDMVKMSHKGIYTCISENIAGSQELSIFIVVNPKVKIINDPKSITVDENYSAMLKCDISIEPLPKIQSELVAYWNKIITLSYLKSINNKSHQRNSGKEYSNYTNFNEAENNDSNKNRPLTKEKLIEKWVSEFNWDFYTLEWKRDNGRAVKNHQDHISVSKKDGILKFQHVNVPDKGVYWCEVTTASGLSLKSQTATLGIIEKLKFSPAPVNKRLELNSSQKIHCKAHGTPTPIVLWFRDSNDYLPDDVQSINGTLHFSKVTWDHKGNYTCVAKNPHGSIESTIFIDVVVSPRFIFPLPNQIIDVTEGDPVWIHCVADGNPEPKTQWDRNRTIIHTVNENKSIPSTGDAINHGVGIDENERINLLENGTLYIKSTKIEDGDNYGCTAGNSAGLRREEVTLIVHSNVLGSEMNEDGVITKAIFITMSVVGAYMILVIGLMVWCRIRRRRKLAQSIENEKLENGDVELKEKDGPNDKLIQNNDDIINTNGDKYCQIKNAKNKCNGSGNLKAKNGHIMGKSRNSAENCGNTTGGESGQNMSDNSEISANSKNSRKVFGNGNSRYDKISMPRSLLYDIVPLGRGEFGDVMLAKYANSKSNRNSKIEEIDQSNEKTALKDNMEDIKKDISTKKYVMIKSLLHTKDESHLAEFKRELDMYSKLKHENISEIIGLCNEMEPHYLVFEYTDWGDLKQFLLATRTEEEVLVHKEKDKFANRPESDSVSFTKSTGHTTPLLVPQMLALVHQMAKALEYMSDNRMIHKDLATRNCLISSKFTLKISIPALTKDIYSKEYYKHVNRVIPLRWLPFECVFESDYTTKSDVYMFACTVWEIFYKAELPFIKMSDSTVLSHIKNSTLAWKPHSNMPPNLVKLLESCWDISLKNRPSFTDITRQVAKILKESSA